MKFLFKKVCVFGVRICACLALGLSGVGVVESSVDYPSLDTKRNIAEVNAVLADAVQISAGSYHTCVLTPFGGIKCWGATNYGYGSPIASSSTPIDVIGLTSGIISISAGDKHTCALNVLGAVKCWGDNNDGQLGDGTSISSMSPVDVTGLGSGVSAISASGYQTCVLLSTGGVKCWGGAFNVPIDIAGLTSGVTAVAVGEYHTCVIVITGGVKCWGYNNHGQLGDGTYGGYKSTPVDVLGLTSGVAALDLGNSHSCALLQIGAVKCWGDNTYGELGDGTSIDRTSPITVTGLPDGAKAISAGGNHTCVITSTGGAKCWGKNLFGQLGDGTNISRLSPIDVINLSTNVVSISAGGSHTCAIVYMGRVQCWGSNAWKQLGGGQVFMPVSVFGLTSSNINSIDLDSNSSCVVFTAGSLKCWGDNSQWQLADGTQTNKNVPVLASMITSTVNMISNSGAHTCFVTVGGGAKCWGKNTYGQLGNGTKVDAQLPMDVDGLSNGVVAITSGEGHTCALVSGGHAYCWGDNSYSQLGRMLQSFPVADDPTKPLFMNTLSQVISISAGGTHTCALINGGQVQCWGSNAYGQLGYPGASVIMPNPAGINNAVFLSLGSNHSCALTNVGGVKCWGDNTHGQLGDGTTTTRSTPGDVIGLTQGVVAISAGSLHTCAILSDGSVKCWGWGFFGQLGNGVSTYQQTIPVSVKDLGAPATAISAGGSHTCALLSSGGVKCWGDNSYGQLGDGTAWRTTPVDVLFPKSVLPPPLPKGCGGGGTPISYNNETCCVKGYVYVNEDPVSGAVVKIGYGGHEIGVTTSEVDSSGRAYYTTSLNDTPLSVPVGGSVVITASYGGATKTVTTTALMGSQQVDVALAGGSNSQPVATIRKMTPADAKQGSDTISFYGVGQDADGTDVIGQYEWVIAHGTANFSVTSAVSNFVLPADSLTWPGVYTVSLRVKDDEGMWSGVVQQRLWVRNPDGGITSGDTWTILIYADGDNNLNLSLGDYVGGMVRRLKEAQGLSNVNVYMWYDGPGVGDSYEFIKFASGGFSTAPVGGGELRMDEKATLVNFARAGMIKFPSDHTMLIVADHANGVVGISEDDSTDGNGRAFLTPIDLRAGIQEITEDGSKKLDIVLFDGCSFGQFEDVATMDGQAYYVIASPNTGWGVFPYERYRELASAAPTPRALAQAMAQRYAMEVSSYGLPYTVAAYDLSRFGVAKQAIGTLGTRLITYINGDPVTRRPQVSGLRTQAQKYDSFDSQPYQPDNEDSYVDIGDFSRLVAQNIGDSGVVSAATGVTNVLNGGSLPLIMYKAGASGHIDGQNSEYGGTGMLQVDLTRYGGLGIFYPPRTSSSTSSAYYNYITNQLFHITWNWGWTSFIATGPAALGGDPAPMPGNVLMAPLIPCGDTAEPNDSMGAARGITVGVEESRLGICAAGDEDWYWFTAQGGGRYEMETYSLTVGTDTVMWVYDGGGVLVGSDDNGNAGVSAGGSRVERVLGNGRYYVKVAHVSASAGNVTLKYALRVSVSQPPRQVFVPSTLKSLSSSW